jgi:hypothetical protein
MRKHFLILMLLALLPFAGWAADTHVTVSPAPTSKIYGAPFDVTAGMLTFSNDAAYADADDIAAILQVHDAASFTTKNAGATYPYSIELTEAGAAPNGNKIPKDNDPANGYWIVHVSAVTANVTVNTRTFTDWDDNVLSASFPKYYFTGNDEADRKLPTADKFQVFLGTDEANRLNLAGSWALAETDTYGTNTAKGTANNWVKIVFSGNYAGTIPVPFEILGEDISGNVTVMAAADPSGHYYFKNQAWQPTVTVYNGEVDPNNVIADTYYNVTYGPNKNVGEGTIKVTFNNTVYSGEKEITFNIEPKAFDATVDGNVTVANTIYTGIEATPDVTVKDQTLYTLVKDQDYTVDLTSTNKINAGEATVTITAKQGGNYTFDPIVKNFTIGQMELTDALVAYTYGPNDADNPDAEYSANNWIPSVKITVASLLSENKVLATDQYTVTYKDMANKEPNVTGADFKSVNDQRTITIAFPAESNFKAAATGFTAVKNYSITQKSVALNAVERIVGYGTAKLLTVEPDPELLSGDQLTAISDDDWEFSATENFASTIPEPTAAGTYYYRLKDNVSPVTANYTVTARGAAMLKITAAMFTLKIDDKTIEYREALPNFTVTHVSGLSDEDVNVNTYKLDGTTWTYVGPNDPTANKTKFQYLTKDLTAADFTVTDANNEVYTAGDDTHAGSPVSGNYTIKYTGTHLNNTDYAISVQTGTLTLTKKELRTAGIHSISSMVYQGRLITAADGTVAVKDGNYTVPAEEYNIDFKNAKNAGNGLKATISVPATSNYTIAQWNAGTVDDPNYRTDFDITYSIAKAPLKIKANAAQWKYGHEHEYKYTATIDETDGLRGDDNTQATAAALLNGQLVPGIGTLTIKRISSNTVGSHPAGVSALLANEANYTLTAVPADLNITIGDLYVKVADKTIKYGDAYTPKLEPVAENSGLAPEEVETFDQIVDVTNITYNYVEANMKNVDTYPITASGTATSTNYIVHLVEGDAGKGTLTIEPAKLKLQVYSVSVAYEDLATFAPAVDGSTEIASVNTPHVTVIGGTSLKNGDAITAVAKRIYYEESTLKIGTNALKLELENNNNYDIVYDEDVTEGVLTVTGASVGTITLYRAHKNEYDQAINTTASEIYAFHGLIKNVKFNAQTGEISATGGGDLYPEKWYALVLPFETSVAEISSHFGYAVVDVLDKNGNDADNVSFKVYMGKIKANQPFLLKVVKSDVNHIDENIQWNQIQTFENKTIKDPSLDTEFEAEVDQYGNKFDFTYSGKNGGFDDKKDYIFKLGKNQKDYSRANTTDYVPPMGSWVHFQDDQVAARTITIEEADGSTTAIRIVNDEVVATGTADGWYTLDGMKLDTIPAQKGVYINNGKKVVIK